MYSSRHIWHENEIISCRINKTCFDFLHFIILRKRHLSREFAYAIAFSQLRQPILYHWYKLFTWYKLLMKRVSAFAEGFDYDHPDFVEAAYFFSFLAYKSMFHRLNDVISHCDLSYASHLLVHRYHSIPSPFVYVWTILCTLPIFVQFSLSN